MTEFVRGTNLHEQGDNHSRSIFQYCNLSVSKHQEDQVAHPHIPPHIHRAYHSFCHAIHLRDNCPATRGGCGPLTDLPSHLKHVLRSFPGINALLVTTSLSFPAPADGTVIAGPNETFEMPSTKSEALMKRRGLSMIPAASSRWPNEINRLRVTIVGRHDAMLFRSSGTTDSE
jgi:hypothetical protein